MNAIDWVKKLRSKLLGKKVNTPASGGLAGVTPIVLNKKQGSMVLDGVGVIQLPEHWRN